ncbi:MAG: ATP-dependent zinc metalloprotease FtsH [Armatimonadetes bacterium]|nr:ATP-dependent zinc metalloprotease FtsH [Armatimonadota bacterium]MDE2206271.1 ATP-dependent zinc metalloprotease FtsH [Armatimonadota bacterium]
MILLFQTGVFKGFGSSTKTLTYSELLTKIHSQPQTIAQITFEKDQATGTFRNTEQVIPGDEHAQFEVNLPDSPEARSKLIDLLQANSVTFQFKQSLLSDWLQGMFSMILLPVIFIAIFWILLMRQSQSGGNQALNFGRSRAKRLTETVPKVTFGEVAGVDEAKQELEEIVEFLKNAKKFQNLGAKIPKGVLLLGPPGCGKTMLARAVAGEAGVPFFHISGSDFVEMFVGVGASRVRDLFETAKTNRPSLIFIDEIDAVGRQRGAGLGGGHDEREQTLNQLLVEMDGFDPNAGVIMIAATNRPDVLDPALLRPGRFDRRIVVDAPDVVGRKAIFEVHLRGKPVDTDVNVDTLARLTPGFTGADIMNVVNEAAILAARRDKSKISMAEFDEARDRVLMGPERKTRMNSKLKLKVVAYHELGHAIVAAKIPNADPVYKITVIPRGMSGGATWFLPKEETLETRQDMLDDITASLGGRVAEQLVFGDVTTGASADLDQATNIARAMVCEYGMSERLGPLRLGRRHGNPFLGRDIMEDRDYSEEVARAIDEEVRAFIDQGYTRAVAILTEFRDKMDEIADVLMVKETLTREEFLALLNGEATGEQVMSGMFLPPPPPPPTGTTTTVEPDLPRLPPQLRPEPA